MSADDFDSWEWEDYLSKVTVAFVPEGETHVHGECSPDLPMWLHTIGMTEHYDKPELEIRDVPYCYAESVASFLNRTAQYSVFVKEVVAEETIATGEIVPVLYHVQVSPDKTYWQDTPALRLVAKAGWFECTNSNCPHALEEGTVH